MASSLSALFEVINRRGGTVVVYDAATDRSYLLQPLESAAKPASTPVVAPIAPAAAVAPAPVVPVAAADVSGLTEEQLLAKINRDIALWRTEQAAREVATGANESASEFQFEPADDDSLESST